jgi:hypothetical protein
VVLNNAALPSAMSTFEKGGGFWGKGACYIIFQLSAFPVGIHAHKVRHLPIISAVTSNIDWCENNYESTHFVAEFHNSWTSLFFCLWGLLASVAHWNIAEKHFQLSFMFLTMVGLGSAAFHGILTYQSELWDEIPMVRRLIVSTHFPFF